MKLFALFFLLALLMSILVSAGKRVTLSPEESYRIEDKNITFVRGDSRYDHAIFCVNGKRGIIREEQTLSIHGVSIELHRLRTDSASIEVTYECKKCLPCIDCDNSICFTANREIRNENEEDSEPVELDVFTGEEPMKQEDAVVIQPPSLVKIRGIFIALLTLIVLLLGIIVLWRKS